MSEVNLADPDCEPTDDQFRELMRRAFADLPAQEAALQERLRQAIAERVTEVRARLAKAPRSP